MRDLSAEITRTPTAGANMSASLTTTITALDGLMKRFGVGEPTTNVAPATNSAPFNILDYATAAGQITAMTESLNAVLKELNTTLDPPALDARLSAVNRLSDHATDSVRGLIYLVFGLAALLILFTFICVRLYRAGGRSAQVK